jgi:hypothetical protein
VESGDSRSEALLRAAVGERPDAVLVSTDCLGPCSQGSVVAVGRGQATVGRLTWLGRPVSLGLVERPERARNLNNWIRGGAPDLITLPTSLLQSSADS